MASPASSFVMSPTGFTAPTMADSTHPLMEWLHKGLPAELCTGKDVFHPDDFPVGRLDTKALSSISADASTPGSPMSASSSVSSLQSTKDRAHTHMAEITVYKAHEIYDTRVLPVYAPVIRTGSEKKIDGKSVYQLRQRDETVETANLRYHALEFLDDEKDGVKGMTLPQQGTIKIRMWEISNRLNINKDRPYVTLHYQFSLLKMAKGSASVIREFLFVPPAYVVSPTEPARPALWAVMQAGVATGSIRTKNDGRPIRPEGSFSGHGLKIMFGVREDSKNVWLSDTKHKVLLLFDHAHDRSPHMIDNKNFSTISENSYALRDWAVDGNQIRRDEHKILFTLDLVDAASMKENPHDPSKWWLADLKKKATDADVVWVRRILTLYEGSAPRNSFKTKQQFEAEQKKKKPVQDDDEDSSDDDDSDEEEDSDDENSDEEEDSDEELDDEELEAAYVKAMAKVNPKSTMMTFAPSRPFKGTIKSKQGKSAQNVSTQYTSGNTLAVGGMKHNGMITPPGYAPYGIPSPVSPVPWNGSQFGGFPGMQMPGAPPMHHMPGFNPNMPPFAGASEMLSYIPPGYGLTTTPQGFAMLVPLSNLTPQTGGQRGRYQGENSSDSGRSTGTTGGGHPGSYQNRRNSNHSNKNGNGNAPRGQNPAKRHQPPAPQQPHKKKSAEFGPPRRTRTTPVTSKENYTADVQVQNIPARGSAKDTRIRQIRKARSWRRSDVEDSE